MQIRIQKVTADISEWDQFVDYSNNGTIFHKLKFLQYHPKKRFNFHHLVFYCDTNIIALLPGMLDEDNNFKSPAGASYGSFVTQNITLAKYEAIIDTFLKYAKKKKFKSIVLTPPPTIYLKIPNEIERFLLEYKGFKPKYHLITNAISLDELSKQNVLERCSAMCRRAVKKSFALGVNTEFSDDFDEFYPILVDNKKKFNVSPTHTLVEIRKLKKLFPSKIKLLMAYDSEKKPVAGILLFVCNRNTLLTFYISHYFKYQNLRAVNRLFYETIIWAKINGFNYVDLGVSMDTFSDNPMEPSRDLIHFKEGIGSRGFLRTTYHYEL